MKAHYPYLLATLAAVGCTTIVHADDASTPAPDLQVTYNVGAQSDYIFRGISQTDRGSSGFAGVDATYRNSLYAGVWTSNVDFSPSGDPSTRQEYDLYGGWRPNLAGFAFDIGYIYYGYTHQPHDLRESYAEGYLKITRTMGPVTLGVATYRSPDFPGAARRAHYLRDETRVDTRDETRGEQADDHPQQLASRSAHAIGLCPAVGMMGRTPGQEAGTMSTRSAGPPSALLPSARTSIRSWATAAASRSAASL